MRHILYTRHDGGVSICTPAPDIMEWMSCGGYWRPDVDLDEQVERSVAAGHSESAVRRYIKALTVGGCTTAECYELIRDRDCGHLGTAFELVDHGAIPDRWFRDAWRRGHNGGAIEVDMPAARAIQFERLTSSLDQEQARRRHDLSMWRKPIRVNLGTLADRIEKADSPCSLKAIWWTKK